MKRGCLILQNLHNENTYQKDFTAEIINVLEKDNKYLIELDMTYFSPQTSHHPHDLGSINNAPITDIYEENDRIYHVVEIKPTKIHRVKCIIDFEKKYDYMKQHLGQHIISACFLELFNGSTIAISIGNDYSYIDIDKIVGTIEIKTAEEMANKIIMDNIKVEVLYPTNAELKKLSIKKVHSKPGENIRIIKIGDIDITPCKGIHPNSTIEVQMIKVSKWSKQEKGTRIEFICGSRATSDYLLKHEALEKISSILHCSSDNMLDKIQGLTSELNKALSEKNSLKAVVAEYEVQEMLKACENIKDIRILKSIYDNVDLKYVNLLATKLVTFPNVVVLFGAKFQDKTHLTFMRSKDLNFINMNALLKDAITLIDGKGGGSEFSAQGAGKSSNNLDSSLDYACNKIKDSILNNFI
jgi:alanyl-tRNA synthetase